MTWNELDIFGSYGWYIITASKVVFNTQESSTQVPGG